MIVGTAGHIDHGKTALVKALTGIDADRLKEEKARGITIDLGFAYRAMPDGRITGFVDVPGHERLVHTMLAGAIGIDFVMLVVAADDGPMPQTREHLAILDLLGIRRGVVALTKVDLVDAGRRAAVAEAVRAALLPTGLRGARILPVSAVSREGLADLEAVLAEAERDTPIGADAGLFRLAVDRCFTLAGAGTVVTGTILSGSVTAGDRLLVSPSGITARVRSVHAQNQPVERALSGQRCALNLSGEDISKAAIIRGDVVLDPALHAPTARIDAEVHLLPSESRALGQGFLARFHHASTETGVRIVPLDTPVAPGHAGKVQLVLDRPIAAAIGDRFVLRDASAQRTIGGGRLLDLRAPARKRRTPERQALLDALAFPDPGRALAGLLAVSPFVVDLAIFARDHALTPSEMNALCERVDAERLDAGGTRMALAPVEMRRFRNNLHAQLAAFHAGHADRQGMGREDLRRRTDPCLPPQAFLSALQGEARSGAAVIEGGFVRLPGHAVRLSDADDTLWRSLAPRLGGTARFRPPRVRDLAQSLGRDEADVRRVLKLCATLGRVDQVAHDHFFLRDTTAEMVGLARAAAAAADRQGFTAAAFRDYMDNGRKVAIQILDFFDRHGITVRRGDLRRINPHRLDLFGVLADDANHGRETFPVGRPDFKSGWDSEPVPGGFDSRSLPPPSGRP